MSREGALCRIYAAMLYAYPKSFRARFGTEMRQAFRDRCRAAMAKPESWRFLVAIAKDWMWSAGKERVESMSQTWNKRWVRAARGFAVVAVTLAICMLASAPFLRAYVITGGSMEETMQIGDHVLVRMLPQTSEIRRGEIVALRYPLDLKMIFFKRVIGIPGDRIRLMNKQVIRNGKLLIEPYAVHLRPQIDAYRDNFPSTPNVRLSGPGLDMLAHHVVGGEVVVPPGMLFVLGDNRDDSLDSRYWGFVPREDIVSRPLFVYWSWDAATHGTRWNRTFTGVDSAAPHEVER